MGMCIYVPGSYTSTVTSSMNPEVLTKCGDTIEMNVSRLHLLKCALAPRLCSA
jgi:hypothetical protein